MIDQVVIPVHERPKNEVDVHLELVEHLQQICDHDFRLTKEVVLTESQVAGVFIACDASRYRRPELPLKCIKCSLEEVAYPVRLCVKYLGRMEKGELESAGSGGIGGRERYFGSSYVYYAARIYSCSRCGFTVVADEWDQ